MAVNGQSVRKRVRKLAKKEEGTGGGTEGVPSVDLLPRSKVQPASEHCLLLLCLCLRTREGKAAPRPEGSDLPNENQREGMVRGGDRDGGREGRTYRAMSNRSEK